MTRRILILLIACFIINEAQSQSVPMYSQYMYSMININPAVAGNRNEPGLTALWREQWVGLPGSPTTRSIAYDFATNDRKLGLGVQLFDDKYVNNIKRTGVNFLYSLKIQVSDRGILSGGLKFGFYNDIKNLSNIDLGSSGYAGDPAFAKNLNKMIPLAGAGLYYNNDKFYIGASVPDLLTFSKLQDYQSDNALYQVNTVHYFLTSGYSMDINEEVNIKPSLLIKAVSGAPLEYDLNANVWLKKTIGFGGSYRINQSFLAMAELQLSPQLRFGYAYDIPFTRPNSHEFFLRYEIGRLFPKLNTYKIN